MMIRCGFLSQMSSESKFKFQEQSFKDVLFEVCVGLVQDYRILLTLTKYLYTYLFYYICIYIYYIHTRKHSHLFVWAESSQAWNDNEKIEFTRSFFFKKKDSSAFRPMLCCFRPCGTKYLKTMARGFPNA